MTARTKTWSATIALAVTAALTASPASAQYYPQQGYPQQQGYAMPQAMAPQQLDQLVGPIALYPDPLLAQVLTAATFWDQIPEAAGWAQQYGNMQGDQLAQVINQSNFPWDPSVVALLPFPNVLELMMRDQNWTQQLGQAVLVQRGDVMDAVQRMRQTAMQYGYLQNNEYMQVSTPYQGEIQILPAYVGAYYVPRYDPRVVYYRPSRGLSLNAVFNFGPRITIGSAYAPWGWSDPGFSWRRHELLIDRRPWTRTWSDRTTYVHPYTSSVRPRVDGYDLPSSTYYRGGQGVDSRVYDRNRGVEQNRVIDQNQGYNRNRAGEQNRTYDRGRWSDQNRVVQPQQEQQNRSYRMQQQAPQVQLQVQPQQPPQQQNEMRQQRMQQQAQQVQPNRSYRMQQQQQAQQQQQQPQAPPQQQPQGRTFERNPGGAQNQNRGGGEYYRNRGGDNSNFRRDR